MKELIHKRNRYSKTFLRGDGKRVLKSTLFPMHFLDKGAWREYRPQIFSDDGILKLKGMPYYIESLSDKIGIKFISSKGYVVQTYLEGYDWVEPYHDNNSIIWNIPDYGFDVALQCRHDDVEFFKIIDSVSSPHSLSWIVSYNDEDNVMNLANNPKGWDNDGDVVAIDIIENQIDSNTVRVTEVFGQASKIIDPKKRIRASRDPNYPLLIDMPTITNDISDNANDVGWRKRFLRNGNTTLAPTFDPDNIPLYASGNIRTYTNDNLRAGHWNAVGYTDTTKIFQNVYLYNGGFYWPSVNIEQGAVIDSAEIDVVFSGFTDWNQNQFAGPLIVKLYGSKQTNPSNWSSTDPPFNIANKTGTGDPHTITSGTSTGTLTYDVTSAVQAILNQGGWVANNSMRFVLAEALDVNDLDFATVTGISYGQTTYSTIYAQFDDANSNPNSTTLTIVYTVEETAGEVSEFGWGFLPIS